MSIYSLPVVGATEILLLPTNRTDSLVKIRLSFRTTVTLHRHEATADSICFATERIKTFHDQRTWLSARSTIDTEDMHLPPETDWRAARDPTTMTIFQLSAPR